MKVSLEWLRDYAALDAPVEALVRALVESGTEVDRVHRGGEGVLVTRVASLDPIPEARTPVVFAALQTGEGETVRVITGASNLRVGDLVPWAPPGTLLPGSDEPLQVRAMFGGKYQSPGMLCSAAELGVGEDAGGIMILEAGVPGQPLQELMALDVILDVEVTTNRPDCLCHLGIARELAAATGDSLQEPPLAVPGALTSAASVRGRARVRVEDPEACPRFAAAIIESVVVGPSPEWLQRRLRAIGLRPLNNVVDVTNYVAHELGEPLHAFDLHLFLEAASTGAPAADIVVRRGREEVIMCLDGVERTAAGEDVVVCAGERAVSIAGVIGGLDTAVTESTVSVLLEAATWDGLTVRATSRRMGLRTDASALFEKGLSDTLPPLALNRAAALIAELGHGHVLRDTVDERARPLPVIAPIDVPPDHLSRTLGYAIDATAAATALARLGFAVEQEPGCLRITPPHFRRDVVIPADVIEEVGRALGYGRVPATLPGRRLPVTGTAPLVPLDDRVRELLTGAGFDEAITYSFTSPAPATAVPGVGGDDLPLLAITNPLSPEWSVMRRSLLPGLCQVLAANLKHGLTDVAVFEIGRAFWEGRRRVLPAGSLADGVDLHLPPLPAEPLLLGMAIHCGGDAAAAADALRRVQSVTAEVVRDLGGAPATAAPATVAGLRPGRAGRLRVGDADVGLLGELLPDAVAALDLRGRVLVAELELDAIAAPVPRVARYQAPPRFPAIVQDLAVVVPGEAPAGDALAAIRTAGAPLLEGVELYDEYRDDRLGGGHKGWTFRLTYRAGDRTLRGEEANRQQAAIAAALVECCGATIRK
ncbi:MAG: phenylalanine--tRNA ligase subunit beta [Candidatus Dormibacteria bacterium]